ncbi:DUF402 domain-containing protein [Clostridium sp. 'deep sea']|uniref:DUF402 domain-containing protein n=1 Tax=Clostridium sp. 'deep sea' TaxID=2779445 RepID=UPI0018967E1E|nr:DUF402 domain-containing protein [Clostridium sp. 'deep sea']QOR35377.1 DUF402 domain-containing protein [Clostridium sp. 'deep sea']
MKRKYGDARNLSKITKKRVYLKHFNNTDFKGHISLICVDNITEPINVNIINKQMCLVNNGYYWLLQYPKNENYCLMSMYNDKKQIIQWYIDIHSGYEIGPDNVPNYNDLYLDIAILNSGEILLLDEDELAEALESGDINEELYNLANNEAHKIMQDIINKKFSIVNTTAKYLEIMLEEVEK